MVNVQALSKLFVDKREQVNAVDGVTFDVPEGKLFTLLGPSGCGKTTTLRCIAGLEKPDDGEIVIGKRPVYSRRGGILVPPHRRNIGMVFQSYAIWPHMNVFENVAFPLQNLSPRPPHAEIAQRVKRALALVDLSGFEQRPATKLSGGQQQRLSLARAIVAEPRVLLLDEPLSNLDAKLRDYMRVELKRLQQSLGITSIYVTHDQVEALAISDVVAVMNRGQIEQIDSPRAIYSAPSSKFVASFIGSTNLILGRVEGHSGRDGGIVVTTSLGRLHCRAQRPMSSGQSVAVSVRPEYIRVARQRPEGAENVVEGRVESVLFLGQNVDCRVRVGDQLLQCVLTSDDSCEKGDVAYLQFKQDECLALPDTEAAKTPVAAAAAGRMAEAAS